jgi:hypothetical protein
MTPENADRLLARFAAKTQELCPGFSTEKWVRCLKEKGVVLWGEADPRRDLEEGEDPGSVMAELIHNDQGTWCRIYVLDFYDLYVDAETF